MTHNNKMQSLIPAGREMLMADNLRTAEKLLRWSIVTVSCIWILGCSEPDSPDARYDLAIRNVGVIDVAGGRTIQDQTVFVRNGTIVEVSDASRANEQAAMLSIDGSGKYVMPALADMHVHLATPWSAHGAELHQNLSAEIVEDIADEVYLYLANGVTLVRNMGGWPLTLELRDEITNGSIAGPEIVTAGPIVYGPGLGALYFHPDQAPGDWADSAQAGADIVRRHIEEGYYFIKVYNSMSPDAYNAIVTTAREYGVKVSGHVPFEVGIWNALKYRQDSIEHLRGYDIDPVAPPANPMSDERFAYWLKVSDETMEMYARTTAEQSVYNCPTQVVGDGFEFVVSGGSPSNLANYEYLPRPHRKFNEQYEIFREESIEVMLSTLPRIRAMIRALHNAGAPLMAGTDTPIYFGIPGFSLHRELEHYVEAGLSSLEALRIATISPAAYLGRQNRWGQVAPGFEADLIVLKANPLDDIRNTKSIAGVVVDGQWMSRQVIDERLREIAQRQADPPME